MPVSNDLTGKLGAEVMIDCHSHILPEFDDGAADMEVSLKMLEQSREQGVDKILSTSHCYPKNSDSILNFVSRRNDRLLKLRSAVKESGAELPQIYPGCELNMLTDVSEYEETRMLCINNTDYILIEMPSSPWKEWMLEAVYKLSVRGYKPVMAHIDRFQYQDKQALNSLYELDVLYQINTDAFLEPAMSKKVAELLMNGRAHIIGTDMHNLTDRAPNMSKAVSVIKKHYGDECLEYFEKNALKIINGEEIEDIDLKRFKKKPLINRIFGEKN